MKTYYIVTGRIPYDDEDSLYIVEADNLAEAQAEFERLILEDGEPTELDEEGNPTIYLNCMVRCEPGKPPELEWSTA